MALSTSGPIASASPASVITLIVLPVAYRQMIAASTDNGNRHNGDHRHPPFAQKDKITSEQRMAPSMPSCTSASIDCRT